MPFRLAGVEAGARSTIVRLPDSGLWVHSPIALSNKLRREVEAIGPVRFLIASNRFHYGHLKEWATAYPDALVCAVSDVKAPEGVVIGRILTEEVEPEWANVLSQTLFRGSVATGEAVFCHRASRTLILTDTAIHIPSRRDAWSRFVARVLGVLDVWAPTRYFKASIRDKGAARRALDTIMSWDFERLIIAHGDICETGGKAVLRRAYGFLEHST
ncbi:MAG: DUF4336 domain-containing protein [Armatimonadetes bacterium]|nr:DUF4336 domain-containing protein [Armatimonadota bacterium]